MNVAEPTAHRMRLRTVAKNDGLWKARRAGRVHQINGFAGSPRHGRALMPCSCERLLDPDHAGRWPRPDGPEPTRLAILVRRARCSLRQNDSRHETEARAFPHEPGKRHR